MHVEPTDALLLQRIRSGADESAWHEFDRRYGDLILRYGRIRRLHPDETEDLRQVVMGKFCKILRNFHYSPNRGRFRDYLARIVHQTISEWRRSEDKKPYVMDIEFLEDYCVSDAFDATADAVWEREWMAHHLRLAMDTLERTHEPQSLAIFRRLIAGEPAQHVAADLGLTVEAVTKCRQRLLKRTRELVAEQIASEENQLHVPEATCRS